MRLGEKSGVENPTVRKAKAAYPELESTKMDGMGHRSWPDRCFWIPGGRPFLIEFKVPGEKPTELQQHRIEKLRSQGYDVEVHTDPKEAFEAIRLRMERARLPAQSR